MGWWISTTMQANPAVLLDDEQPIAVAGRRGDKDRPGQPASHDDALQRRVLHRRDAVADVLGLNGK